MASARRSSRCTSNTRLTPPNSCYDSPILIWHAKAGPVFYVYILRSKMNRDQTYVGSTSNLKKRFAEHNAGKSRHTNKFKPWELLAYIALSDKTLADRFERYLKTGSGRAFAVRHLGVSNGQTS